MEKLLRAAEAKRILNVATSTLYRLVDDGILPAVILVRRRKQRIIRFRPAAIERFIQEREQ